MIMKKILMLVYFAKLSCCGLLRTPKVYNALITTDENIVPSRSYPIVQPHIHETGIYQSYPFGGYNPFGLYDPYTQYRFGPPHAINTGYQGRNNYPIHDFLSNEEKNRQQGGDLEEKDKKKTDDNSQNKSENETAEKGSTSEQIPDNSPKQPDNAINNNRNHISKNKSPIPLNQFGLPPSLVPYNPYGFNQNPINPINLAPYPYNSYPLVYDQYTGYQTNPYLPPFGHYPQTFGDIGGLIQNQNKKNIKKSKSQNHNFEEIPEETNLEQVQQKLNEKPQELPLADSDSIKNFANKNKDIPDVPPPPLPSGAKSINA